MHGKLVWAVVPCYQQHSITHITQRVTQDSPAGADRSTWSQTASSSWSGGELIKVEYDNIHLKFTAIEVEILRLYTELNRGRNDYIQL